MTTRQVMERWLQVYPGNITQAAELTTAEFRAGVSIEEWIDNGGPHFLVHKVEVYTESFNRTP